MLLPGSSLEFKPERKRRILGGDSSGDYEPPSPTGPMHDPLKKPLWALLQWAPRRSFRMVGDQLRGYWDLSWTRRRRFMTRESVLHASVVERWHLDATYRPPNVGDIGQHPVEQ
ncbi:MAG: hypothetical protein IT439_10205 [Phycisphaerales bacterium]|nr:hypothetical protein [Phycisphaerales bacterium]